MTMHWHENCMFLEVEAFLRMHWFFGSLLMVALGWNSSALGQPTTSQAALVDEISSLRLQLERLEDTYQKMIVQRDSQQTKLFKLTQEIGRLKNTRSPNELLPNFKLQRMLGESQELSSVITLYNREIQALQTSRNRWLKQLVEHYEKLIQKTMANLRSDSKEAASFQKTFLASIRKEQQVLQQRLEQAMPIRIEEALALEGLLASEDPEELLERADAIKDEQDRLSRTLAQLNSRIGQVQSELRLQQELFDFVDDQTLFNEESRGLFVSKGPESVKDDDRPFGFPDPISIDNSATNPGGVPPSDLGHSLLPNAASSTALQHWETDSPGSSIEPLASQEQLAKLKQQRTAAIKRIEELKIWLLRLQKKIKSLEGN